MAMVGCEVSLELGVSLEFFVLDDAFISEALNRPVSGGHRRPVASASS